MRILLVAPVHWDGMWEKQKYEELRRYGEIRTPFVIGQGQYFWWKALRELGHEVKVYRYSDPTPFSPLLKWAERIASRVRFPGHRIRDIVKRRDIAVRNDNIVRAAQTYQPDVVIVSGGRGVILAETIRALKAHTNAKLAHMNGTSPVVFADTEQKKSAPYYDCIFTNDYYHSIQWRELGAPRSVALPVSACDPAYHHSYELTAEERARYTCDVCFIGRLSPENLYAERIQALMALTDFDLGIWTDDEAIVRSHPQLARFYRGRAHGIEMLKILSITKIALNIHGCFMQHGGNMRTFEIPAVGAFQLIDRYDPAWFREGEEIVSFQDLNDLRKKVRYYLKHDAERQIIAKRGQERACKEHTYMARMSQLIENLGGPC